MARARNIKPGFFTNEELVELPFATRLLFIGLWTLADREGRMEDRPKRIKMALFPADDVNVDNCLNDLQTSGFLTRYSVDGVACIQIDQFVKHQNPHHMEAPSVLPAKPGEENRYNHTPISPKQRARIYARDNHQCVQCGQKENLQIDHEKMVCDGGTSDDDNLRTLCAQCNNKRSKKPKPEANPADSLIPDSLNLIPDSGLSDPLSLISEKTTVEQKPLDLSEDPLALVQDQGEPVQVIFAYWQKVMKSPKSALDNKRKKLIKDALKAYPPADICKAIRGCSKTPHNMGQNKQNTKYNGLNLILRDAEHIDYFINLDDAKAKPAAETVEQMNARVAAEFLGDVQADDENTIEMEA